MSSRINKPSILLFSYRFIVKIYFQQVPSSAILETYLQMVQLRNAKALTIAGSMNCVTTNAKQEEDVVENEVNLEIMTFMLDILERWWTLV